MKCLLLLLTNPGAAVASGMDATQRGTRRLMCRNIVRVGCNAPKGMRHEPRDQTSASRFHGPQRTGTPSHRQTCIKYAL